MVAALVLATLVGPDGPFHVAVSERGVVAAESGGDRDAFETMVAARFHGLTEPDASARTTWRRLEPAIQALLDGAATDVLAVPIDLRDRAPFDQDVLAAVREVPWGRTASYGEIARRVGTPRAARAVGGAVGRCPISLLIPCHRIIASDGTIGGYGGEGASDRGAALDRKRWLLLREGVTVGSRAP
jgi:O-6-methylguanine DNA methyltransferase